MWGRLVSKTTAVIVVLVVLLLTVFFVFVEVFVLVPELSVNPWKITR